jgi:hypothetical protein
MHRTIEAKFPRGFIDHDVMALFIIHPPDPKILEDFAEPVGDQ